MSNNGSKQKILAAALVAVIALLGLSTYLLYRQNQQNKLVDKQGEELMEAERMKTEVEKSYYQTLSELEEMKGNNQDLNGMIDSQKLELKKQKEKISRLLTDSRNLSRARDEIGQLRTLADKYIAEISALKNENQKLATNNVQLREEKKILTSEVEKERRVNDDLVTTKTVLETEVGKLEAEKLELASKVDIASAIKIGTVSANGYKIRNNGKDVKKDRAKNIDKLVVCFNTTVNDIILPGEEEFHIRLIDPLGETLAVEALGSGVIMNNITQEEVRYTQSTTLLYENNEANSCIVWQPETIFQAGKYEVEVYNKGYPAGNGSFELK
jgi:predicted  nucleic acid-binding Zn-ribbon protein